SGQPYSLPSAGSVFKNPKGDFAGRLIEAVGLKGKRVGKAEISKKHANFIVNLGGAKAKDVLKLMILAQKAIKQKFKIKLEPEIRII
ncbi:MAG: UDP-N-acetylenolpyruvoylglucosamine reductase, partial [Candidatus Margulisiibacteriota bacterium]